MSFLSRLGMKRFIHWSNLPVIGPSISKSAMKIAGASGDLECNDKLAQLIVSHYWSAFQAKENGRKVAWVDLPAPIELFYAFDIIPFQPEGYGGVCAATGFARRALEKAESFGFPRDGCSFNNHLIGSSLLDDSPVAEILVATMIPNCDAKGKAFEAVHYYKGIPLHFVDVPFLDKENAVEYFREELAHLIEILEQVTGRPYDPEKLKSVVERSNEITRYFRRVLDLRKTDPLPLGSVDGHLSIMPMFNLMGDLSGTLDYYTSLCEELKYRIEKGIGIGGPEPIRLMNTGHYPPLYYPNALKKLDELGAAIVIESFATFFWEAVEGEDLLEGLAKKYLSISVIGDMEKKRDLAIETAKKYEIDAAIQFLPWGCKVAGCNAMILKDALRDELGIPTLVLDVDPMDPRSYSPGQIDVRIAAFIEMLRGR